MVPAKEHRFPSPAPGQEHQNGVGLLKPREVQEIRALPEGVVGIAVAKLLPPRGQKQRALRCYGVQRRATALRIFLGGDCLHSLPGSHAVAPGSARLSTTMRTCSMSTSRFCAFS